MWQGQQGMQVRRFHGHPRHACLLLLLCAGDLLPTSAAMHVEPVVVAYAVGLHACALPILCGQLWVFAGVQCAQDMA
jgi:hypothetical protein